MALALSASRSRSIFMPRWRFTRTEAGVNPVSDAISGPVIPSTSRSVSVSRYASGRVRITASTASARIPESGLLAGRSDGRVGHEARATMVVDGAMAGDCGQPCAKRAGLCRSERMRWKASRKTSCSRSSTSSNGTRTSSIPCTIGA